MGRTREEYLDIYIEDLLNEFNIIDKEFDHKLVEYLNSGEVGELEIYNVLKNIVLISPFVNNEHCFKIILNFIHLLYDRHISITEFKVYILDIPKETLDRITTFHNKQDEKILNDDKNKIIDFNKYR